MNNYGEQCIDKTPVKGGRWRTHSCALNLEPLWREVLEGGSRASAPKESGAKQGGLTITLAKVPLVDRPAFSIKPLAECLGPVLIGTKKML